MDHVVERELRMQVARDGYVSVVGWVAADEEGQDVVVVGGGVAAVVADFSCRIHGMLRMTVEFWDLQARDRSRSTHDRGLAKPYNAPLGCMSTISPTNQQCQDRHFGILCLSFGSRS